MPARYSGPQVPSRAADVSPAANPAVMAAIGMFSGYCGTLMTPMAANFNIVPAALLELEDKNAVIRAQVPTALAILVGAALGLGGATLQGLLRNPLAEPGLLGVSSGAAVGAARKVA